MNSLSLVSASMLSLALVLSAPAFAQTAHDQHQAATGKGSGVGAGQGSGMGSGKGSGMGSGTGQPSMQMGKGMMRKGMTGKGKMHGGMMGMMRGKCMMMGKADMPTHAAGRIAFIKAELGITGTQQAAWDGFASSLNKHFEGMKSMRKAMMARMKATTPIERISAHVTAMEGKLETLKQMKVTLDKLYVKLSVEQKEKANKILTSMGCVM